MPSVRHTLGSLWRPGSSWGRGRDRASLLSPVDGGQGSEAVSSGSAEAGGGLLGFRRPEEGIPRCVLRAGTSRLLLVNTSPLKVGIALFIVQH